MAAVGELVHPEAHHCVQAQALPRGGVLVALAAHSLGPQKEAPLLEFALGFTKKGAPFLEFALGFTKIPELAVGVFLEMGFFVGDFLEIGFFLGDFLEMGFSVGVFVEFPFGDLVEFFWTLPFFGAVFGRPLVLGSGSYKPWHVTKLHNSLVKLVLDDFFGVVRG